MTGPLLEITGLSSAYGQSQVLWDEIGRAHV